MTIEKDRQKTKKGKANHTKSKPLELKEMVEEDNKRKINKIMLLHAHIYHFWKY